MAGKREMPEEIVSKLRQVQVLQGQGMTIADEVHNGLLCLSPLELCQYILAKGVRKHGSEAIF